MASPISPARGSPRRGRVVGFTPSSQPVRQPKVAQVYPNNSQPDIPSSQDDNQGIHPIPTRMSPGSRIGDGREDIVSHFDGQHFYVDDIPKVSPGLDAATAEHYFALNMEETLNQTELPDTTLREIKDHNKHFHGQEVKGHQFIRDYELNDVRGHKGHDDFPYQLHSDPFKGTTKFNPAAHFSSDPYDNIHHHSSIPDYKMYSGSSKIPPGPIPGPIPGSRTLGNPVPGNIKINLSHWQQNLDSQILQQQMQRLNIERPYLPPPVSGTAHGLHGTAGASSYPVGDATVGVGMIGSSSNMEGVIRAKEGMLHERNIVIERQKLEIAHLQKQIEEQENIARQRLFARSREDSDVLFLKMQEYQYEIASLRAQLAEVSTAKMAEGEHLNRKLGEVEESHQTKDKTIADLRKKLRRAEMSLEEKASQLDQSKRDYEKLKKKITKMEQYMHDLPTADEYRQSTDTIKDLHHQEGLLRERITSLEESLTKTKQKARKLKHEATEMEDKNNTLQATMDSMKKEMARLQRALGSKESGEPTDLELCSREDISQIRGENDRLSTSVEHLKKVIESKHRHMQKVEGEHQKALRELESRLTQEEGVITALRLELKGKDKSMHEMSRSMKELASQSQELYDHNLSLQENIHSLERAVSSDKARLTSKLLKELTACVQELQRIVELCSQGVHGQEPNMSLLLGFRPSSVASYEHDDDDQAGREDIMKSKLTQVQKLRGDIDILRNLISDKYAEDVGSNCITQ